MSTFHPIRDSAGIVEAVLGVEYAADDWLAGIQRARFMVIGYLSLILAIVMGGVGLAVSASLVVGRAGERGGIDCEGAVDE